MDGKLLKEGGLLLNWSNRVLVNDAGWGTWSDIKSGSDSSKTNLAGFLLKLGLVGQGRGQGWGLCAKRAQRSLSKAWSRRVFVSMFIGFVVVIWNLLCTLHSQHISIQTTNFQVFSSKRWLVALVLDMQPKGLQCHLSMADPWHQYFFYNF